MSMKLECFSLTILVNVFHHFVKPKKCESFILYDLVGKKNSVMWTEDICYPRNDQKLLKNKKKRAQDLYVNADTYLTHIFCFRSSMIFATVLCQST